MYFNGESISDYYRNLITEVRTVILKETKEQIIGSETEELAQYYFKNFSLSPIEFDSERDITWTPEDYVKTIHAHEREYGYQELGDLNVSCQRIKVEIPIIFNKDLDKISNLHSSVSYLGGHDKYTWSNNQISFNIETKGYGTNMNEDGMAQAINGGIERIKETIERKNNDINKENENLLSQIRILIEERKSEIKRSKDTLEALTKKIDIPLKKIAQPGARKISLEQKPIIKNIKPTPHIPEEYRLDENKVTEIIEVIDNQSKSFEKTPQALEPLNEENLRDLILSNINSIFQGKATGETFSKKGKTDIYLNIDKGNILIFECKIWGGKKLFFDTINQLRNYLTWRHNYGVVIFFVKVKNFTKILSEILSNIKESESYINGAKKLNDTHFIGNHKLDDEDKIVNIHFLFYNLYISK